LKSRRYSFAVDSSWLEGAELLVLQRIDAGRFSRTFEVRDFRMADHTLEKWQERAGKDD
jgi:hypothetical protein